MKNWSDINRANVTTHSHQGSPAAPAHGQTGHLSDGRSVQQVPSGPSGGAGGTRQQSGPPSGHGGSTGQVAGSLSVDPAPNPLFVKYLADNNLLPQKLSGAGPLGDSQVQQASSNQAYLGGLGQRVPAAFGATPVPLAHMPPPSAISLMPRRQEPAGSDAPRLTAKDWEIMGEAIKRGGMQCRRVHRNLLDIMLWKAETRKPLSELPTAYRRVEGYQEPRKMEAISRQMSRWNQNRSFEALENAAARLACENRTAFGADDYDRVLQLAQKINAEAKRGRSA